MLGKSHGLMDQNAGSLCKRLFIILLQENTVVQTCVVACSSLAFAGGFGCYLLSMDQQTFENLGNIAGNRPEVRAPFKLLEKGCRSAVQAAKQASCRDSDPFKLLSRTHLALCVYWLGMSTLLCLFAWLHASTLSVTSACVRFSGHDCRYPQRWHVRMRPLCLRVCMHPVIILHVLLQDVYEPHIWRSIPYLLSVGIIGIFTLVILRKRFIIDYRLQYPSGTATGVLIASFHTPKGEAAAREQVTANSKFSHAGRYRCIISIYKEKHCLKFKAAGA